MQSSILKTLYLLLADSGSYCRLMFDALALVLKGLLDIGSTYLNQELEELNQQWPKLGCIIMCNDEWSS